MELNKKTIIQLVIILVAFGLAGLVLYNGFFNNQSPPAPSAVTAAAGQTPQTILPYGEGSLDFSVLKSRPFVFNQIQYQTVDPSSEVGVSPYNMISAPITGQ